MEPIGSAISLMGLAPAVVLTTLEADGSPWTRAMLNLRNHRQYPDLKAVFEEGHPLLLYFTTNTSSPKLRHIRRDPRACAYFMLPDQWWGLTLTGDLDEERSPAIRERLWQKGWEIYYPGGPGDEDYAILRMVPTGGRLYKQLQSWPVVGSAE